MDEAREGIVFFLVNNLPGASKLRALHYKRLNLAQVRAPHHSVSPIDKAITFLVRCCSGQTLGPVTSDCLGLMSSQSLRRVRGSERQLGDQDRCCRQREPCVVRNYPDLSVFLLCLPNCLSVHRSVSLCPLIPVLPLPWSHFFFVSSSVSLPVSPCPFPSPPVSSGSACHFRNRGRLK